MTPYELGMREGVWTAEDVQSSRFSSAEECLQHMEADYQEEVSKLPALYAQYPEYAPSHAEFLEGVIQGERESLRCLIRQERQKSLIEQYHQRFLKCEATCKQDSSADYSALLQTWRAMESDEPAEALQRWIERTQNALNRFKDIGQVQYFNRKLEIFEQAKKEVSNVVLH